MTGQSDPPPIVKLDRHPSIDFIDNRLANTDPKFVNITGRYDPASQNYVAPTPPGSAIDTFNASSVQQQKTSFEAAIRKYYESRQGSKLPSVFSTLKTTGFSWDDVIAQANEAEEQYQGLVKKGIVGNLRGRLRNFSKHTDAVKMWMDLLPSDGWQASLACGGIKVVLQAATVLGAIREDMCDALEQIPETIVNAQTLAAAYPDASMLREHTERLYVAILDLLEHFMFWYRKHSFRKLVGAILNGPDYGSQLRAKVSKLKTLESKIDKAAIVNLHAEQALDRDKTTQMAGTLAVNTEMTAEVLNGIKDLLNDRDKNSYYQKELSYLREQLAMKEHMIARERRAKIEGRRALFFHVLGFRQAGALKDLQMTLRIDPTIYDDAQDRAAWMIQSPEVARWLGSSRSRTLIINGGESTHDVQSATSFFTAMMVRSTEASAPAIVLQWFCGQHIEDSIPRMLRSLIGQLIEEMDQEIELPDPRDFGRPSSVEDLAQLFRELLLEQLQHTSVVCILDAVSFYEDQDRSRELCYVFNRLSSMTKRVRTGEACQFKLLVTSPTRAMDISTTTGAMDAIILDCPDEVEGAMVRLDETDLAMQTHRHLSASSGRLQRTTSEIFLPQYELKDECMNE
ncbi:Hypothetical protein R9X50_00419400 [Acrodontium crateriforme]|uniref:Uncharacterized protein n=1 Tax=Acrodontium crateriforme TaxID=150365 RepID=A0AAQ3MAK8_9PEZI|nr:Hypothetical protein R9X50_00419400 [Acrodontium crateriforme]